MKHIKHLLALVLLLISCQSAYAQLGNIPGLTTITPAPLDEVPVWDDDGSAVRNITIGSLRTAFQENGTVEMLVEALGTACTAGQVLDSDGSGGIDCISAGGDVSGALDALVVTDDSHAHTTTTVSGLNEADVTDLDHLTEAEARTGLIENGSAEMTGETLGTACAENQILKANATGGLDCAADADSGGTPATADISDVSVTQTELAELETIGATTISANQWAMLGGVAETLGFAELDLLDGITVLSGSNTGDEVAADLTTAGVVELATVAETNTGTDATRAVTPAGIEGWTGSTTVTTLGTIATGVWNGTSIADANVDDNITIDLATSATTASNLAADGLDAVSEIASGIKRGPDATDTHLLTTDVAAPGSATCLEMDTDGSVILASGACGVAGGEANDDVTVNAVALNDVNFADTTTIAWAINRTATPDEATAYVVAGSISTGHIGTDGVSADELNATGVEAELEAVLDLNELQGAVTDGQVPNDITIDLATLATTLTITDNEATAETNAVLFTAGGALTGGDLGIESDGDLTYTPSTGTLTATTVTGANVTSGADPGHTHTTTSVSGLATTDVTTGTFIHERGGLETDVSAYAGLIRIAAGATTNVTDLAGLNTAISSGLVTGAHTVEVNDLEGAVPSTIATTEVFIGTGAGTGAFAALSGDATMSNGGVVTVVDDLHAHVITNIDAFDVAALQTQTSDVTTFYTEDTVVPVADGGTGASTFTDGGILLGSGTGAITALAQATNGQIPVGSTGVDPVLATITGTANEITVTNGAGTITLDIPTQTKSMFWGAGALSSDGTNCADPAEVTVGSWGKMFSTICTDNDGSIVTGTTVMPDGWDFGTVTFELQYIQDAADTAVLNADVSGRCNSATDTPTAYGSEVAIDDAAVTGSDAIDMTTSGAVTLAGGCAAGDILQFQIAIDATGTTTAMATLNIIGVKMEYGVSVHSD